MFDPQLLLQAERLLALCREKGLKLATAESCTGGLVAAVLTSIAGSSDVIEAGIVSYSNEAKTGLLGVPADLIARFGAVSEEVAFAMAEGVLVRTRADISVSVTGVAGPGGGSAAKPVGLVHLAAARSHFPILHRKLMLGDVGREKVRLLSVEAALGLALAQAAAAP